MYKRTELPIPFRLPTQILKTVVVIIPVPWFSAIPSRIHTSKPTGLRRNYHIIAEDILQHPWWCQLKHPGRTLKVTTLQLVPVHSQPTDAPTSAVSARPPPRHSQTSSSDSPDSSTKWQTAHCPQTQGLFFPIQTP